MEILGLYGFLVVVQIGFWYYMFLRKGYRSILFTGLIGGSSIYLFIDWYYNNVFIDPCAGNPDCMNETGMLFVFSLMIMVLSLFISVVMLYILSSIKRNSNEI